MCDKPKNKPTHLQWNANRTGPEMYQTRISKYRKMPDRRTRFRDSQQGRAASPSDVPVARHDPLVGGQVGGAHRAAGVKLIGADPDLSAQAIFAAIGEPGAGVDDHAGGINPADELVDGAGVGAENPVRVPRAVTVDVVDRLIQRIDTFQAHHEGEILG